MIPEINIKLDTVHVEPKIIKLPSIKIVQGTPVFGMSKSARKYFGITKKEAKKLFKKMRKDWKEKYES